MKSLASCEALACPLCGGTAVALYGRTRDYNWKLPGVFDYQRCAACGLVFEHPRPPADALASCYPARYGSALPPAADPESRIRTAANVRRAQCLETASPPGRLFDVGCGSGFFLAAMRRHGWTVAGVESASDPVAYARERLGLMAVRAGRWPVAPEPGERYDVVSFIHVLEHLPAPVEALRAARAWLTPGGRILIETPNICSWPARVFGARWVTLDAPRHLCLFSCATLRRCVEAAEFQCERLSTYSPATLEYSESLRYLLRDLGLRRPEGSTGVESSPAMCPAADPAPDGLTLKGLAQAAERGVYRGLNRLADCLGQGNNLLCVARLRI